MVPRVWPKCPLALKSKTLAITVSLASLLVFRYVAQILTGQ